MERLWKAIEARRIANTIQDDWTVRLLSPIPIDEEAWEECWVGKAYEIPGEYLYKRWAVSFNSNAEIKSLTIAVYTDDEYMIYENYCLKNRQILNKESPKELGACYLASYIKSHRPDQTVFLPSEVDKLIDNMLIEFLLSRR